MTRELKLIALLLHSAGLRFNKALALRVKDVSFERRELLVRRRKGARDRETMPLIAAAARLSAKLLRVRELHDRDLAADTGRVALPRALERKAPAWTSDFAWPWVFP